MSQSTAIYDDVLGGSYVRGYYNGPAHKNGRVTVDGKPGVIAGFEDQYLLVLFNGGTEPDRAHPTWRVVYLDADRAVSAGGAE